MTESNNCCSRRNFLKGLGCGGFVALSLFMMEDSHLFAQETTGKTVINKPFARVEKMAPGVWTIIATPTGGPQVMSNSGIIQGKNGVLVVDACMTVEGSHFIASVAKELTGSFPTHVALTHFHIDHSSGLVGYVHRNPQVKIISTLKTQELLSNFQLKSFENQKSQGGLITQQYHSILPNQILANTDKPFEIDLGGKIVKLVPRVGHTASDVTVEIDSPRLTWGGDLILNGLFPYYADALPSQLEETCNSFLKDPNVTYVPGHGAITNAQGLSSYLELLGDIRMTSTEAFKKGIPASQIWKEYKVPKKLGNWAKFRPDVFKFAFDAWEQELQKTK
ncbi:MBL fold metallo-hydrolase [Candidatus Uabimicrobium sp. HlEnr_7]|uniref:MBL fold metallo-hydrolase n=1 Tax=Candidatus Uabimicrobium helgolandensis TaxID=3095367 RepID=UPI00355839ED